MTIPRDSLRDPHEVDETDAFLMAFDAIESACAAVDGARDGSWTVAQVIDALVYSSHLGEKARMRGWEFLYQPATNS